MNYTCLFFGHRGNVCPLRLYMVICKMFENDTGDLQNIFCNIRTDPPEDSFRLRTGHHGNIFPCQIIKRQNLTVIPHNGHMSAVHRRAWNSMRKNRGWRA